MTRKVFICIEMWKPDEDAAFERFGADKDGYLLDLASRVIAAFHGQPVNETTLYRMGAEATERARHAMRLESSCITASFSADKHLISCRWSDSGRVVHLQWWL